MTIEFWPRRLLKPKPPPSPKRPRKRRPKLPIGAGKANQLLSSAIICGDHELASWLDLIFKRGRVTGRPEVLNELKQRLDDVMEPLPGSASHAVTAAAP
jgi:hypothetical protein